MDIYLVTGGAGFIGSNFIKYILASDTSAYIVNVDKLTYAGNMDNLIDVKNNKRHKFIKADICDSEAIHKIMDKYKPKYIINFAAESHVDRSIDSSESFIKTNVLGTNVLLEMAKLFGIDRYVQISTDEVYGSIESGLFNEESPLKPNNPYAASKASADLLVQSYYSTYNLPVNITRCTNNFGPYQHNEKLVPKVIENYIKGRNIPVYGDGSNIRDWIYVVDHCRAIASVLYNGKYGEIYNIGTNNELTNLDIIKNIINEVDRLFIKTNQSHRIKDDLVTFVEDRKGHDKRYGIDANKIKKELNWSFQDDFTRNISDTVKWYFEKIRTSR